MNSLIIACTLLFILILVFAIIRTRRANREQSASEMHPDNFKKPQIEKSEDIHISGIDSDKKENYFQK